MYKSYNFNKYLTHNRLNKFLSNAERNKVKYIVYADDNNIIYFINHRIDNFCVRWLKNGKQQSLRDKDYFNVLYNLGQKYGNDDVWNDWDDFALKMISNIEDLIYEAEKLDNKYPNTKFFWIIMGLVMYAEDIRKQTFNKNKFVYLKRNMKRLAAYNILKDGYSVDKTVTLTEKVPWRKIKQMLVDRNIYVNLEDYPTPYWDGIYDKVQFK